MTGAKEKEAAPSTSKQPAKQEVERGARVCEYEKSKGKGSSSVNKQTATKREFASMKTKISQL